MKRLLFTLAVCLIVTSAWPQSVPKTISFQGYLTDKATGDPLNGNFDMRFALFDASTGGTELWFDDYTSVPVAKGLYSVILGDKKPINLPFNQVYYVQMKVGLENLDTRLVLTSSAYSISSTNANNLISGTISNSLLDADLQDLADGSLSGSLVGPGVSAANIAGTLAVANGGTGASTLTGLLIGNGTSAVTALAKTGGLQYLRSNAGNTAYEFASLTGVLTNNEISGSAAISGSKVVPAFGAQNISTTGTITGASFTGAVATSNLQGTVGVTNGGTGSTTLSGVLFGNGASAFTGLSSSTPSSYLRRNAANNAYEFGTLNVVGAEIQDNTITDSDIAPAAAIAGTKINPNFGSQTVITSGTVQGTTLVGNLDAATVVGPNRLNQSVMPTTVPLGNGTAGRLTFWSGTSAVSSSGSLNWDNTNLRLGIGATPATTLHVLHGNGASTNGLTVESSAVASSNWNIYVASSGDLWLLKAGAQKGAFNATSGAYTSTSDRRLKKDIVPLGSMTSKLMTLVPYSYRFKDQGSDDTKTLGFIAQDVREVFPEMVKHNEETDVFTLDYSGFGVVAVKVIQEQQKKIDELSNEIMELRRAVEDLKSNLKK